MSVETGDLISRIYANFRGVDFRGEEINTRRSPDALNVWKDYKYTESIRTRPGLARKTFMGTKIYGIYFYRDFMIVHRGRGLEKVMQDGKIYYIDAFVEPRKSNAFIFENVWYFMDGKHYLRYDGETISDVVGYIPTTSIGRKPAGGGTIYEDVNMLSDYRKNTFLASGTDFKYYLDATFIDDDFRPVITVNGRPETEFVVDYENGTITFKMTPITEFTDGRDNVEILFKKTKSKDANGNIVDIAEKYRNIVLNCTMLQVFDNRVFISGNPDFPNTVWHCSLNDPTYFSDLDYYREGIDTAAVKGLVAGNNALWVFREPTDAHTTVFYHTPTIDSDYGKIYPSQHSSITTGCVGAAVNFNDDIVFFSDRGMEGISGDVTTEQAIAHRSSLVDRKLISETGYRDMVTAEWEGYLLVFIGNKVYLADSRTAFTNENHIEYEWFYWELDRAVTCAAVKDGVLYLGTEDGVYTLSTETDENGVYTVAKDLTSDIESYWVTPKDKINAPHKLKTTNKRGCVVEATGDISLLAKLEDTEFEPIGTYEGIEDYFVARIKKKKFKDIQLKFHSTTRFSLETATLECFIGGYIKR